MHVAEEEQSVQLSQSSARWSIPSFAPLPSVGLTRRGYANMPSLETNVNHAIMNREHDSTTESGTKRYPRRANYGRFTRLDDPAGYQN